VPTVIPHYACSICRTEYDKREEAVACESVPEERPDPKLAPGTIVFAHSGFGWFDGDRRWVSNPDILGKRDGKPCPNGYGNCFEPCCTYRFYYVVTIVEPPAVWVPEDRYVFEKHRVRYYVETKAMSGKQGHRGGYTSLRHHIRPAPVKAPPAFVVRDARDLVGQKKNTDLLL
jgi:hypothetical protein